VPPSFSPSKQQELPKSISREHYLAYRLPKNAGGVYLGFLDPVFGIRVPEHNAYIRSRAFMDINDQTHGVMLHSSGKTWDAFLHGFIGNLFQSSSLWQTGATLSGEFEVAEKIRPGASIWYSKNDFRSVQMAAVFSRHGLGTGSSLLGQFSLIREAPTSESYVTGDAVMIQSSTRLTRGAYHLMTFEHFAKDLTANQMRTYRVGPTLQYFPVQRLELRVDFQATRVTGQSTVNSDIYALLSQIHIWL
jgi:hypothetical protein